MPCPPRCLRHLIRLLAGSAATLLAAQTASAPPREDAARATPYAPKAAATATLKDAYHGVFHIGAALNPGQFTGANAQGAALVLREFDSISPENVLKWESVEPEDGAFRFELADQYVEFGVQHKMFIIGHTLVWHKQLPAWVAQPSPHQAKLTKEVLLKHLHDHIMTVAGRYKGKVHGWDVLNEAVDDNGGYRDTVFYRIIGKEYIPLVFKWAREADPHAELYYNDYNLDASDAKRATAIELIKYLRSEGAPIDGVGLQGHYNLNSPSVAKIDETIRMFAELGLKVMITELDVQVNRNANAAITGAVGAHSEDAPAQQRPLTEEQQQALARRYGELFGVFRQNRNAVTRVTLWGLRDTDSWRRNSSPLLFDDDYRRKPAYDAVINAATMSK